MAAPASRIVALDALRGAGILGILVVHIQTFAMPLAARSNPTLYGDLAGAAGAVWLATYVLADGKFIAVFAMLFGAGIALMAARHESAGRPAALPHYRRMTALCLVGVLHAYLLWYGDMLVTFALCGGLVFLHRNLSPARLIAAGVIFLAVAPVLSSAVVWASPELVARAAVSGSPEAIARELTAYRGGWLVQQGHRSPTAWGFETSYFMFRGVWQTSGLMLIGMGLLRLGVLTGERSSRWYLGLAAAGFGAGIPLMLAAVRRSFAHGWDLHDRMLVGVHLDYWGNVLVGLGWLGAILLLHRSGLIPEAIVTVGRTALSNYLLATVLCTTVFYGHGLGLFGTVERPGQLAVVGAVWAIQLLGSSWWLGRFAAGPLEWLLRWATNGRPGPIKLTTAPPAAYGVSAMPTTDHAKPGDRSQRVIVKFRDTVVLPYEDAAERHLVRLGIGQWSELADRFKGIRLDRLFTVLPAERLGELVAGATNRDRHYRPPNLLTYFVVDCLAGTDSGALARALGEWAQVEIAYVDPLDASPAPVDNPHYGAQTYLKPPAVAAPPAPQGGIDAEFAWPQPGGRGTDQKIVDLERGAKLNHEDLVDRNIQTLHGQNDPALDDQSHGASVLGIVAAVDNDKGVIGIAHDVGEVAYSSQVVPITVSPNGVDRVNAVTAAIAHLTQPGEEAFGRVLLLEVHLNPVNDPMPLTHIDGSKWSYMPMETAPADFDIIRLATALGIVVVEAAGNGQHDLDVFQQAISGGKFVLSRTHPDDFKESGAIMVGGSTWTYPYRRWVDFGEGTCFGSRVDCFAWGENVRTCAVAPFFGDVYDDFGGTSSASAIVAGAALLIQGVAEKSPGPRLGPGPMRALLSDPNINTLSENYGVDRIGVMPNLKRIIQDGLGLAPDVYMRDYVGDTGDVHAGAISASPDVIVRPAPVVDPAVTFGPATAGDTTLGSTVTSGQDNFVYVRVWNRGGVPATGVKAKVFYASPATLLTFDDWSLIGEVTIPNVPPGNIMTVSGPITWPAAAVPPPGHYCFIALVGNAQDPAPEGADFLDLDYYYAYIRTNNNVTWRNFDVVAALAAMASGGSDVDDDAYGFEFAAPGAADRDRYFQLAVGSHLPPGSRVWLEAPAALLEHDQLPFVEVDTERRIARMPIGPHGRTTLPRLLFPARSRSGCRLLLQVPRAHRDRDHEVYVSQLYEGFEVGRMTWRITAKR